MAPPQVNLNEKPPAEASLDPLPEKKDSSTSPVIVTVENSRRRCQMTAAQRQKRKRCRIACCISLSFLMVLLLALGTGCLIYRMKHRRHHKHWRTECSVKDAPNVPEHVHVDDQKQLIYVKPEHPHQHAFHVLHEYNRGMIAFKNETAKVCYLDRLDETFEDGITRWEGYVETGHVMNHTLRVIEQKIDVRVVQHFADVHIYEHCGKEKVEYHWVMAVTQEEILLHPTDKYINV